MNIEVLPNRKPRSDSALKSFSQEVQDEIVQYAQGRSLREVQAWLQQKHHVKRALSTISEFLSWSRVVYQNYANKGAVEGLLDSLGVDAPKSADGRELTPEELRPHVRQYFLETIVHDCNISAWHQSERIAVKREELELNREKLELKREQLELKRERLELKRKINERKREAKRVEPLNGGIVESAGQGGKGEEEKRGQGELNIQQPTSNIQHPVGERIRRKGEEENMGEEEFNIQHPTSNSDKSRAGIQHPVEDAFDLYPVLSGTSLGRGWNASLPGSTMSLTSTITSPGDEGRGRVKRTDRAKTPLSPALSPLAPRGARVFAPGAHSTFDKAVLTG